MASVIRNTQPSGAPWDTLEKSLNADGWAMLPLVLDATLLIQLTQAAQGGGQRPELKNAPAALTDVAREAYTSLLPIVAKWMPQENRTSLGRFPLRPEDIEIVAIRLDEEGYLPLQNRMDDPALFPVQLILNATPSASPCVGGELVLTEQRPRMQSRPTVVPFPSGSLVAIPVGPRPFAGRNGTYRVIAKHAISRVVDGQRLAVEILFRPAKVG